MSVARERLTVLLLGVLGGGLALLTAGRRWLTVVVSDPLVGNGQLHPDGRAVASLVPAAALVALAATVAAVTHAPDRAAHRGLPAGRLRSGDRCRLRLGAA